MRNILKILTLSAAAASVAGCAYGGLGGLGYNSGYGYSPYGYGSPYGGSGVSYSVGYSSGYGSPYGYGYGSPYGYGSSYGYGSPYGYGSGYGSPYYGWYNNSYYPGTGIYVYDSYRRPRVWTNAQRDYWSERKRAYGAAGVKRGQRPPRVETNWSGFRRDRATAQTRDVRPQARSERGKKKRTERVRDRRGRNSD